MSGMRCIFGIGLALCDHPTRTTSGTSLEESARALGRTGCRLRWAERTVHGTQQSGSNTCYQGKSGLPLHRPPHTSPGVCVQPQCLQGHPPNVALVGLSVSLSASRSSLFKLAAALMCECWCVCYSLSCLRRHASSSRSMLPKRRRVSRISPGTWKPDAAGIRASRQAAVRREAIITTYSCRLCSCGKRTI